MRGVSHFPWWGWQRCGILSGEGKKKIENLEQKEKRKKERRPTFDERWMVEKDHEEEEEGKEREKK